MPAAVKRKKAAPARAIQRKLWSKGETALILGSVYLLYVFFRYALAKATSAYPVTVIDEFLYYGLARSIANGEGLLFRGQPAAYAFVLYPLLLSPVYKLFGGSANMYRLLQLWNILIMTLSLFPVYALSRRVLGSQGKALGMAALALLLPEMILGGSLISECVIYPLFFCTLYFAYRYLCEGRLRDILLVGVIGGLMYFTKPGQAVPGGVFLAFALACGVIARDKKQILKALGGAAAMLLVIGAFYLIVIVGFGQKTTLFSLYDRQLPGTSGVRPAVFFKAVLMYAYYFILASGVLCFLLPLIRFRSFEKPARQLYIVVMLSLAITILGTAAVINMAEYRSETVHMRYIAMYVPALLMFCFVKAPGEGTDDMLARSRLSDAMPPLPACAALALVLACAFLYGCGAGTDTGTSLIANLSLSMCYDGILSQQAVVATVLSVLSVPLCYLALTRLRARQARAAGVIALSALMCFNNITGYSLSFSKTNFFVPIEADSVLAEVGDKELLYVFSGEGVINYASIDVRRAQSECQVTMNDLFNRLYASGGVYAPFVPVASSGTTPSRLTPDTDTMVMDMDVYDLMATAPGVGHFSTVQDTYHVVTFQRGQRLADSMIGNVAKYTLPAGQKGIIAVFDPALAASPLTVRLEVSVSAEATVTCLNSASALETTIGAGRQFVEFPFDAAAAAFNFSCSAGDMMVYGYELLPAS